MAPLGTQEWRFKEPPGDEYSSVHSPPPVQPVVSGIRLHSDGHTPYPLRPGGGGGAWPYR